MNSGFALRWSLIFFRLEVDGERRAFDARADRELLELSAFAELIVVEGEISWFLVLLSAEKNLHVRSFRRRYWNVDTRVDVGAR